MLEKNGMRFGAYYRDNLDTAVVFRATAIENQLKQSEQDFLDARNRCGGNQWCIEWQYLYQDQRIADMSGEPHPVDTPLKTYLNHYVCAYLESCASALVHGLCRGEGW